MNVADAPQFIFRFEVGDAYLGAVSRFMTNAFEYGDALLPQPEPKVAEEDTPTSPPPIESNQPYLNLATFRMVVLADEVLESFFETDLSASFRLVPLPEMELPISSGGFLGDIWSSIATDTNKKMFNLFTDEIGKTIGRHQVIHRPSIGRYTKLEEPKARESLLTPHMRKSTSTPSLKSAASSTTAGAASISSIAATSSSATLTVNVPSQEMSGKLGIVPESGSLSAMPMMKAARDAALMERTPFAIDNADEGDEDDDDFFDDDAEDDQVLDEVSTRVTFLVPEVDVLVITGRCLLGGP